MPNKEHISENNLHSNCRPWSEWMTAGVPIRQITYFTMTLAIEVGFHIWDYKAFCPLCILVCNYKMYLLPFFVNGNSPKMSVAVLSKGYPECTSLTGAVW